MSIPIVVGVTGHRDLRAEELPAIEALVTEELNKLKIINGASDMVLMSSIAAGADSLCAEIALKLGYRLVCPLPMEAAEYRKDFTGADAERFDRLLAAADCVYVAPDAEKAPFPKSRDYYYRQAGICVAMSSHVLMALWDGSPAKEGGCGTAEAVAFAMEGLKGGDPLSRAGDGAVLHIRVGRVSGGPAPGGVSSVMPERQEGRFETILMITNEFNHDEECLEKESKADFAEGECRLRQSECQSGRAALLSPETLEGLSAQARALHRQYLSADRLALYFQQRYMRAIRRFSVFGALLVLFFLLYDELDSDLFLIGYGVLILVYLMAYRQVQSGGSHEKYLQYRMLAETLRAQFYVTASGSEARIGELFPRTMQQDSDWIACAITALTGGPVSGRTAPSEEIRKRWIEGQMVYHLHAGSKDEGKRKLNEGIARLLLFASLGLFVAVFVMEFFFTDAMTALLYGGPFPAVLLPHEGLTITARGLFKLLLGGVSAVAVFLANYYGKLSLDRKCSDHYKMADLYKAASEKYDSPGVDREKLFCALAREEIAENGSWFSYCRENPPTFNV